jgi:carbamate kinase
VASPLPQNFVGLAGIKYAFAKHQIAVAAIGGGVPCVIKQHAVIGKEGVIDKDYSTSKLAQLLNVDRLVILTAVPGIYLNYGKPNAKLIGRITIAELAELIKTNDFGKGSMLPKINAAIAFVKATNKIAIITDLKNAEKGINLLKGTIITP